MLLIRFLPLLFLLIHADLRSEAIISPFEASYRARISSGLPFRQSAHRALRQLEDKSWLYTFQVKTLGATLYETSHFIIESSPEGQKIIPQSYGYHLKGWAVTDRTARLSFNHHTGTVLNDVQNQPWQMKVPGDIQDKLSLILQLRLALQEGKTALRFPVADGGLLKTYVFTLIREESITVGHQSLPTVVVQKTKEPDDRRPATLWLDKTRHYRLVKLVQEEHGEHYEIFLERYSTE